MRIAYSPEEAASYIANNDHSFAGHVETGSKTKKLNNSEEWIEWKEWQKIGVHTRKDYENHIAKTVKSKETEVFQSIDGQDIYYNRKTKTVVVVDMGLKGRKESSTCFIQQPLLKGQKLHFENEFRAEVKRRSAFANGTQKYFTYFPSKNFKAEPEIKRGHSGIYNRKKINEFVKESKNLTKRAKLEAAYKEKRKSNKARLKREPIEKKQDLSKRKEEQKLALKKDFETKQNNLLKIKEETRKKVESKKLDEKNKLKQEQTELERKRQAELERKRQIEEKQRALREAQFKQNQLDISKKI